MKILIIILFIVSNFLQIVKADWVPVNNGLTQLNVNALTSYSSGGVNYVFAGTLWGAESGIFLSTNNGNSWNLVLSLNTDVWSLANTQSGGVNYIYAGCANSFYRSTNNGLNWVNLILPNGSHWYYAVAAAGNNVFAGCKWWSNDPGGIYKSTNFGANWVLTSFPTFAYNDVYGLEINGNNIYAGSWSGTYVSTNLGSNWIISSSGTSARSFSVINNYIFAGGGGGVFVSTNNGMNWTQTSLNNTTTYSLLDNNNIIFAGGYGGGGFQVSTDNGVSWQIRNEGGIGGVRSLCISENFILAGTDGSGGFRRPLSELVGINPVSEEVPSAYKLEQNFPNPFNSSTKIGFHISKSANVIIKICDLNGKEISLIVNEYLNAGKYEIVYNAGNISSGIYYYRLIADGLTIDTKKLVLIK